MGGGQLPIVSNSNKSNKPCIPTHTDEFWTAKQRAGHSIHEVSYRACYKPQLPAYFIKKFCQQKSVVYDPFMGRGTTLIEAKLQGHAVIGNDINPLAKVLVAPRLNPPSLSAIKDRLDDVNLTSAAEIDSNLLVFFHQDTLQEIYGWKHYFQHKTLDKVDAWLQMVACNRLTGHSPGFFSVYTLPPNLATSVVAQRKINRKRNQTPEYRNTKALILRKSKQLLRHPLPADFWTNDTALLFTASADNTAQIDATSIDLIITSPPFLDTVNYKQDNWLRMWFCGVKVDLVWQLRSLDDWVARMRNVFVELRRVLKPYGRIAFEVGEVRKSTVLLEDYVCQAALQAGLQPEQLIVNRQNFTKTANCWGIANNSKGTNSNRIVVLKKTR